MKGHEHYAEAERLAGPNGEWYCVDAREVPSVLARAQVHATLALAAAAALPTVIEFMGDSPLVTEWGRATGWIVPAEIVDDEAIKYCGKENEFGPCTFPKDHLGECNSERMPF